MSPGIVLRTIGFVIVAVLATVLLSFAGLMSQMVLAQPLFVWVYAVLALAWLVSLLGLFTMRASYRYVLRSNSLELEQGIARKKSLIVSPSGFSELELDQGLVGRMLNYGSLEIRSQGGQQLNLMMIKSPKDVSAKIREVMTTPTVRIARDTPPPAAATSK